MEMMKHVMFDGREELRLMLKKESVRFGDFTLTSGKKSNFLVDCKSTVLKAHGHLLAAQLMHEIVIGHFPSVQFVAGVELGGCPLASAVSMLSAIIGTRPIDALYVRKVKKEHGTGELIEGKGKEPMGAKVVLLEDVVTTGGSSLRAVKSLQENGFDVIGVVAILDRLEGASEAFLDASIAFRKVFSRKDMER